MENKSNEFAGLRKSETARIAEALLRGETPNVESEPLQMNRTEADRLREVQNTYIQMKREEALEEGVLKKIKRFFTGGSDELDRREAERAAEEKARAKRRAEDEEKEKARRQEREDLEKWETERQGRIRQARDDTETGEGSELRRDDFGNWNTEPTGRFHTTQTRRGKEAERRERQGEERDGSVWETRGGNFGAMYRGRRRYFDNRESAKVYAQSGRSVY